MSCASTSHYIHIYFYLHFYNGTESFKRFWSFLQKLCPCLWIIRMCLRAWMNVNVTLLLLQVNVRACKSVFGKTVWASVSVYLWFFADLKWIGIENAQCAWYKRKWNGVQTVASEKEIIRFFFHGVHVNTFANADTNFVNAKRFIVPAFFFCFALLIFFLFVVFHRLAKELFNLDVSRAMHAHDAIRLYAFSSLLLHKFENFLNHWCQFDSGCPHARQHTTIIIYMNWKIFISTRNFRHRNINLSKKILLWK